MDALHIDYIHMPTNFTDYFPFFQLSIREEPCRTGARRVEERDSDSTPILRKIKNFLLWHASQERYQGWNNTWTKSKEVLEAFEGEVAAQGKT